MQLEAMGDQGALARFEHEQDALAWAEGLRQQRPPWLIDVVSAYATVAVFHDPEQLRVGELLRQLATVEPASLPEQFGPLHEIPCCYALGPDLERVARYTGLPLDEVVRRHSSIDYTVYAIGFCPGFPYLGYLPSELCGVPRLESPRLRVEPGSVGLTGRQTGIYPEARPGGWNLIGRTPLQLVDVVTNYFPLRVGDRVRFRPIDEAEFHHLLGRRIR